MWDLIVSVPDHCLSFYFEIYDHNKRHAAINHLPTTFGVLSPPTQNKYCLVLSNSFDESSLCMA